MRFHEMRWALKRTVEPTVEHVTVDSLRTHCRIDFQDEDDVLSGYLLAARRVVETDTERAMLTQTWTLTMDAFPCDLIELRRCPVQSVTSVTYLDTSGDSQTLATTVYAVDVSSEPARITLKSGQVWPTTYDQANAVTVTFVAGWTAPSLVDPMAGQAIRMLASHWANNRESVDAMNVKETPQGYEFLKQRLCWAGYR